MIDIPVRIDAKGKYYTKVVSTQTLAIIMRLNTGETVHGFIHVRPEHRLSDMMNDEQAFISLTDAIVSMGEEELYHTSFLCINRLGVQWVTPVQAIGESHEDDSDEHEHEFADAANH
jgi:hypothetical protein